MLLTLSRDAGDRQGHHSIHLHGATLGLLQRSGMVKCLIKYVSPIAGALQQP